MSNKTSKQSSVTYQVMVVSEERHTSTERGVLIQMGSGARWHLSTLPASSCFLEEQMTVGMEPCVSRLLIRFR